ncbi:helix-turn-helix domain-containing protein [Sinirhodobacter sp. WL0062]|uniref:Helix-turn-helix domain-containing protein n=1 Tax=Rhodobacter flavimaris TaxID=2907145 RepID=A0ABS8Z0X7_9RHOB|nr:helix-turn-helix transcriptional regulator [Sinirhodobacter sp. WL0062]MCE5975060.1 helix-turn-helix domain-containing protein [Sinirhodobacter sp. WL0062]
MDLSVRTADQIGEAIRRARKARGWTQSDISARTNLRVATISSLENGDAGTKLATLLAVMAALGLEFRVVDRGSMVEIEDIF